MNVGQIIYGILSATTGVTSLVSTRIYPDMAPQNATFPYIVFQKLSTTPTDTKEGVSPLDKMLVQIDCYSNNYDTAHSIAAAIRVALDRYTGTINGHKVDKIIFSNDSSGSPQDVPTTTGSMIFWASQDYEIRLKR
jgi:hypothetical protein